MVRSSRARTPVLVAAFEGWNDAGDAASSAVRWLADRWDAEPFADIDPEDFFDFTSTRPEVRLEDGRRVIDWPANEFWAGSLGAGAGTPGSRTLVRRRHPPAGVEPHLRWRTFSDLVLDVVRTTTSRWWSPSAPCSPRCPTAGRSTSSAPPTTPRSSSGSNSRRRPTRGPPASSASSTTSAATPRIPSASLWAAVPSYVPGRALAQGHPRPGRQKTGALLDTPLITTDLEIAAASYERQINELVVDDDETRPTSPRSNSDTTRPALAGATTRPTARPGRARRPGRPHRTGRALPPRARRLTRRRPVQAGGPPPGGEIRRVITHRRARQAPGR